MTDIRQTAGGFEIRADAQGSPVCVDILWEGQRIARGLFRPSDLHDLRYCIDRVLRQLPEAYQ